MHRHPFVLSRSSSSDGHPGLVLGLTATAFALLFTFWPGVGSSSMMSHRTAKSVAWYVGNLEEARSMSHACLSSEDPAHSQRADDCRNALRALSVAAAALR